MKRWFLATALLFVSAGFASADYVIIIANLGSDKERELRTQPGGAGMMGMAGAGMMGMRGGPGAGGAGMGGAGMMGMRGGPGPGMGGAGMGGAGMMGMRGGPGAGGAGMGGAGMMGMRGGPGMGGGSGMMMGGSGMMMGMRGMMMGMMGGMMGGPTDVDDVPYFVVAVVEVEGRDLGKKLKEGPKNPLPMAKVTHKWGEATLLARSSFAQTEVITEDKNNKPLPTVLTRFNGKWNDIFAGKQPSASLIMELAEWTLEHGLVDKFPKVMDKLVEADKGHPAAVAYLKVKADLDKPVSQDAAAADLRNKLLGGYKVEQGAHYTIVHNSNSGAVESHLKLLENSFRGFYYWFVLKGLALRVPSHRQLVVMTGSDKDFKHFHKILNSGPVVVDGFFARRENLAVMTSHRQDETYDALNKFWKNWESQGFRRTDLFGKSKSAGVPKSVLADPTTGKIRKAEAQMLALMLKALEEEAELATISHDAGRQLLFASGLLPTNVAAPEWILFGMGSFFETPLQSPWAGVGAPSTYYLPRWKDLKGNKGLDPKGAGQTLRNVVTDQYFRNLPAEGEPDSAARRIHDSAVRKARTAAWSLTYFLAKSKPEYFEGLLRYFQELSKMPRDLELSEEVLLSSFARAFGKVDANNKVDNAKLDALGREWYSFMENVHFDAESTINKIRKIFKTKLEESQKADSGQVPTDATGQPIPQPGGNGPPGVLPPNNPGGGVRPPTGVGGTRPPAGGGAQPPAGGGAPRPPAGGGARPPAGGGNRPPAGGGNRPGG